MQARQLAIIVLLAAWAEIAYAEPRRVVSLAPCLDTVLVGVADREQIAGLSRYSRDSHGFLIADVAATIPVTTGTAEEIVALDPDLVIGTFALPPATRALFERLSIPTRTFPLPETVADSIAEVRAVAELVGRPERGAAVVAAIEAALAAAAPPSNAPTVDALVFQAGGFASARGTLMDELMTRAGLANAAPRFGVAQSGPVALERLLAAPPRVLLVDEPRPGMPGWADRVALHPALASLGARVTQAPFPARYLYCGGPVIVPAMAALAEARRLALTGAP
jgi:iron complex transport system substrate-binding protein